MFKSVVALLLLFCLIRCDEDDFVPTKEWQVVRKGQKIPKGLHVRINLETGLTEAKLMEDTPNEKNKAVLSVSQPEKTYSKSTLEEALKNIKNEEILKPEDIKEIKDKFRSYDEIKRSLEQLNLTPKMDAEVIADLLKKHKQIVSEEKLDEKELLRVIEDLDFLAHQYDNAREFVNQNGFADIVYKNLNSTVAIRRETLRLMGSLMQNNVGPKIHALETGAVGILLRLINFDNDSGVKTRALGALSAMLREFPAAQQKFVESGGLTVLSKFFDNDDVKLQIRIVTMISDLIVEHNWAVIDPKLNKYYTSFDLTKRILEHNWCENLSNFLYRLVITDVDDHDSIEKCLTAMHSLRVDCGGKYERKLLESLQQRYQKLGSSDEEKSEDVGAFFNVLKILCDEILHHVYKNSIKTEL